MIFRTFQFCSFLLMIWLIFQFSSLRAELATLQDQQPGQSESEKELLEKQLEATQKIEEMDSNFKTIISKQIKDGQYKKQLDTYKSQQKKVGTLRQAYILVLQAEAARSAGDTKTAMTKLKSSKKLIWQSGDNYPKSKKNLQSLMQVIDATLSAWKNKNTKKNTQNIHSVIAAVLLSQGELK